MKASRFDVLMDMYVHTMNVEDREKHEAKPSEALLEICQIVKRVIGDDIDAHGLRSANDWKGQ